MGGDARGFGTAARERSADAGLRGSGAPVRRSADAGRRAGSHVHHGEGSGLHKEVTRAAAEAACAALPAGFARAEPVGGPTFGDTGNSLPVLELRRREEVTFPQWDYIPAEFYYAVSGEAGDGSGWPAFWRALAESTSELSVSILLKSTDLHPVQADTIGGLITDLNVLGEERVEYDAFGNQSAVPGPSGMPRGA